MIEVVVVDDHPAVRVGLLSLLRSEPGILVQDFAQSGAQALALAERGRPDLVLADYQLAGEDGLSLCRDLKRLPEPPHVLIYSAFAGPLMAVAAVVAGAEGVVSKSASSEDLFAGIRSAARGDAVPRELPNDVVAGAGGILDEEDLPIFGLRVARTPVAQVAEALRCDREDVELRVGAILERLRGALPGGSMPVVA